MAVACAVMDGDPPFTITWLKDGYELTTNSDVSIARVDEYLSTLTIAQLGPLSNGNYTCRVANSAGVDEKQDVLRMKGNNVN